jgi:anti-sigma factor RsiW
LELLCRSFDEVLAPSERRVLEDALAASEELRQERARLIATRRSISEGGADSFRPFFAERVMRRLAEVRAAEERQRPWLGWLPVFRWVAVAGVVAALALIVTNFMRADSVSATAALGLPDVSLEKILEPPVDSMLEELS